MHVANEVKERRCARLFLKGLQKIMRELKNRFWDVKS